MSEGSGNKANNLRLITGRTFLVEVRARALAVQDKAKGTIFAVFFNLVLSPFLREEASYGPTLPGMIRTTTSGAVPEQRATA